MREALGDARLHQQSVNDHFDIMILAPIEARRFVERIENAVDAHASESGARHLVELFLIFALAAPHNRREHHEAIAFARQFAVQHRLDDLFTGLAGDGTAAIGAVRRANRAVHDAEVIINFRDRAHRGTRGTRGRLLLDSNGRRKTVDRVDFRPFHLIEKLARVCRKRFHIAALPFGVNRVKCQ